MICHRQSVAILCIQLMIRDGFRIAVSGHAVSFTRNGQRGGPLFPNPLDGGTAGRLALRSVWRKSCLIQLKYREPCCIQGANLARQQRKNLSAASSLDLVLVP